MASVRNLFAALSSLLLAGVFLLLAVIYVSERNVGAQTVPQRPAAKPAPPASAGRPEAAAPVRTETVTYDAWTVTCRDTADGRSKKICSATLPILVRQQNRQINIGAWIIAHNNEGALLSVLQTPQIDVGVLIAKGVQLKLGDGRPHKINYVLCNPQRCEATVPLDEATIREWMAAANGPAVISIWKGDGAEFSINIQSIKGIDKAIAMLR